MGAANNFLSRKSTGELYTGKKTWQRNIWPNLRNYITINCRKNYVDVW